MKLSGLSACVPRKTEENRDLSLFKGNEAEKFIESTGVERRRIAALNCTTSDLCFFAAEQLIQDLNWQKEDIDCLVFVTQTPDYILPATSCILQERLKLTQECYTIDISLGCSGWVYGTTVITSLLQNGNFKKGLLLVGDVCTANCNVKDKSTWPLFGDAGTASSFEYEQGNAGFKFHMGTDGSGHKAIIIPDGGFRNPFNNQSLNEYEAEEGIVRNNVNAILNGMDVFSFGISKGPQSINKLLGHFQINKDEVDAFVFHQANLFMNENIRKKLKLPIEKVPYSLKNFGNTSCATIPLTMVTEWKERIKQTRQRFIVCAFGVGLSWGSAYFETEKIVCSDLVEI